MTTKRLHITETRQVSREGRGMWQAVCTCGWEGALYGPDAVVRRAGAFHTPDAITHGSIR